MVSQQSVYPFQYRCAMAANQSRGKVIQAYKNVSRKWSCPQTARRASLARAPLTGPGECDFSVTDLPSAVSDT